jgi:hypothetical protein
MILLEKGDYYKAINHLKKLTINNLFARAVIEDQVDGVVYVDNTSQPNTFYVSHPYGMSLLFGDTDKEEFNLQLIDYILNTSNKRQRVEWLQVFPDAWNNKFKKFFDGKIIQSADSSKYAGNVMIEQNTRVNFRFNAGTYLALKNELKNDSGIVRTDKAMYENMPGSVIPRYFWKDAQQFLNRGIGFSLLHEGEVASTAFSAFIFDNMLEIGIETAKEQVGKGFALQTCSALIDYCMENKLEPIWGCKLENQGSFKLAQKLGFEPTLYIPFYKLNYE